MKLTHLFVTGTIITVATLLTGCSEEFSCDNTIVQQKIRNSSTLFLGSIIGIFGMDDLKKYTEDCKKNKLEKSVCDVIDELNQFRKGKKGRITIIEKQRNGNELQCEAVVDSEKSDTFKIDVQYSILKGTDGSILYKEKHMEFVR